MVDLDARLAEARAAVADVDPPGDLWARVVERADDLDAPVRDLRGDPPPRRRSPWLAAAAAAAAVALGAALLQLDDEEPVDTVPATGVTTPTTTLGDPDGSGPVRDPSDVVRQMERPPGSDRWTWADPRDASEAWVDIERVGYLFAGQEQWELVLAAAPPPPEALEPGVLIAYGLVLDTDGDGSADHVIGIDNDAPVLGDFHVWVTDLATGETEEQIGPPYGFPIEFAHPSEAGRAEVAASTMFFTFLPGSGVEGLVPDTVRFYAWTSTTRDGEVVASDYTPDTGWITSDAP